MPLYLKILEGSSPADAEPILATSDPETIAAVGEVLGRTLARRLGVDAVSADGHRPGRVLKLDPDQGGA